MNDALIRTLPLLGIIVVFYFFMIRPQARKQKQQVSFMDSLQKGDEVVTNSGLIGKINKVEDNIITLQVDQKTFVRVLKGSINNEMTKSLSGKEEK